MLHLSTFKRGGVHPDDRKELSKNSPIEVLPVPHTLVVPMSQHLGAPAQLVKARGDEVRRGELIGQASSFVSANVHSPVRGKIVDVTTVRLANGATCQAAVIQPDEIQGDEFTVRHDWQQESPESLLATIREMGIVGMGGATFPTHVKLNPAPGKVADCLIINGAECEPWLTSDFRIMVERPDEIVVGAALMQKVLGCRCVIGVEENKPEAVEALKASVAKLGYPDIQVLSLRKRYPQGGEKQLIDAVLHRQVRSGCLPIDAGAVVQNVATALAVYEAVQKNRPLVTNTLTVTGDCLPVERQHNYLFRIGTPLSFIMEQAGGAPEGAAKIISGGPMMGKAVSNVDAATVKGSSSILYLTEAATKRNPQSNCIRCGKCSDACPMGLEPFLLNRLYKAGDADGLEKNAVQDCIECGCCLYSCPAYIPLLDNIRQAKGQVMGIIRARAAAAKAAAEAVK